MGNKCLCREVCTVPWFSQLCRQCSCSPWCLKAQKHRKGHEERKTNPRMPASPLSSSSASRGVRNDCVSPTPFPCVPARSPTTFLNSCLPSQLTFTQECSRALATKRQVRFWSSSNSFPCSFQALVMLDNIFKAHIPQGKAWHIPADEHLLLRSV